ncbi:MAG: hypothetical protein HeimC2_41700 [Candidatus Heimdallarchaeota archaeon LC_2]|nr:MAG: hypothetical protein HeimC2_41700 [Candidatus Heimdallarchaeota archaeon LC_2]
MDKVSNLSYKDIALKLVKDVYEDGNLDILDDIIHPEYTSDVYYGDYNDFGSGIDNFRKRITKWQKSFQEKYSIKQMMENNEAAFCYYTVKTKQIGDWFGKKPKDKTAIVEGFILFKMKNNKIFRVIHKFDFHDLWSQLGYLVDDSEYQLPEGLSASEEIPKIELNQTLVKKLEENYSILQSSAIQYKDLLQYASYVGKFLDISEKGMRSLAICVILEWQKEMKMHQSDLTGQLPQELLIQTIDIMERGKQKLKNLLILPDDAVYIDKIFDNLVNFFANAYSK